MSENIVYITVFADSNGTHLHQLHSGLFKLKNQERYKVTLRPKSNLTKARPNRQFLEVHVSTNKKTSILLYDLQDSPDLGIPSALEYCDFYIKRSFEVSTLKNIEPSLHSKIIPYGFHVRVFDSSKTNTLTRLLCEQIAGPFLPWRPKNRFHISNLKDMVDCSFRNKRNNLVASKIFDEAATRTKQSILFQCRLWDPEEVLDANKADTEQVNLDRISLVRNLQTEFGDLFIGGIQPSAYAKKRCPELISNYPAGRHEYLKLVRNASIIICGRGLLNSNGGKLAEAIALGKCIVSEPINTKLPVDFEEGTNYISYSTLTECLEIVKKLINDRKNVKKISENNRDYYMRYMTPGKLVEQHLKLCFF